MASALARAPPAKAAARILSPAGLERWWIGGVGVEQVDADWPAVGSHLRFRAGGVFDAEVTENALPHRLVMRVETPSGPSVVTHTFDATPDGGTRYTKVVETDPEGLLARLFDKLLTSFVKREVKRAVADADERG